MNTPTHKLENVIKVGSRVRSFDSHSRDLTGEDACYIEGEVVGFEFVDGCERYVIKIDRVVWEGKELFDEIGQMVRPPLNGTGRMSGGCTDGVHLIEEESNMKNTETTYSRRPVEEHSLAQCPICLRAIRTDSQGRMVRHGYTVDTVNYYRMHNHNECAGWRLPALEQTDRDAQAHLAGLRRCLEREQEALELMGPAVEDCEDDRAKRHQIAMDIRSLGHQIAAHENAIRVHFENPYTGEELAAARRTDYIRRTEEQKEERRNQLRTKAELKKAKGKASRSWEEAQRRYQMTLDGARAELGCRLITMIHPVTGEGYQTWENSDLFLGAYCEDIPDHPRNWTEKRKAKAVARNALRDPSVFDEFDELARQYREIVQALKEAR